MPTTRTKGLRPFTVSDAFGSSVGISKSPSSYSWAPINGSRAPAAIGAAERHPLAPLADEVLELVFDAGAEEVADEAALSVPSHGRRRAPLRHAAAKQRAAARCVRQCAVGVDRRARVHAADVAAEGAVPAVGVVREVEVGVDRARRLRAG